MLSNKTRCFVFCRYDDVCHEIVHVCVPFVNYIFIFHWNHNCFTNFDYSQFDHMKLLSTQNTSYSNIYWKTILKNPSNFMGFWRVFFCLAFLSTIFSSSTYKNAVTKQISIENYLKDSWWSIYLLFNCAQCTILLIRCIIIVITIFSLCIWWLTIRVYDVRSPSSAYFVVVVESTWK